MSDDSPFNFDIDLPSKEVDIEELFYSLDRAHNIENLYAHQADILREYCEKQVSNEDVGIELPTGSGKTLIGLLIGEWRRRTLGQRVLYLCPNTQLAYQVSKQSQEYGIPAEVFVGSKYGYEPEKKSKYQSGDVIAISNYSGLFNTSPGINDPQTIILDDAHGAESYIGSLWSININRKEHTDLFNAIFSIFEKDLPSRFSDVVNSGNPDRVTQRIEKVPYGAFYRSIDVVRTILDKVKYEDSREIFFSWQMMADGFQGCHIYISLNNILIRPYIPPTLTHEPFANADQRLYMSATLGRGGELERITGVKNIQRIPTPKTYESRGIGRRLYLFPDFSLSPEAYESWLISHISTSDRTLILCPSWHHVNQFEDIVAKCSPVPDIYQAQDIESTIEPFKQSAHSVLLLANRYDGIDLPDGICKQVIINGLPSGTNLQEAFLDERLGLDVLLRERIKTRIQQASGRCTRSHRDRASIIMTDKKMLAFCQKSENQKIIHPELRAEIRFGLGQGSDSLERYNAILTSFRNNDYNWKKAERKIDQLRESDDKVDSTITDILEKSVGYEVDYSYALWSGDYKRAVERAIRVSDNLNHRRLQPYRALWNYFVAVAASTAPNSERQYNDIKENYLDRALAAGSLISWFPNAIQSLRSIDQDAEDKQSLINNALAVEGILESLTKMGPSGPKFKNKLDEIEQLLNHSDSSQFDRGLVELGSLLGYSSVRPMGDGAPDACWQLENQLCFILEAKAEENPDHGIPIEDCRQATMHKNWALSKDYLRNVNEFIVCMVSPRSKINPDAIPYGDDVFYISINGMKVLFDKTKQMLIECRPYLVTHDNDSIKEHIIDTLNRLKLTPSDLKELFTSTKVIELPQGR